MLKRNLLVLGLVGALAFPAGLAFAASDDVPVDVIDATTVTAVTPDQNQARDRIHDPGECDGTGPQLQDRAQRHAATNGGQGPSVVDGESPGGFGAGPRDGTGPLHEGPLDGTGNRYGRAGA